MKNQILILSFVLYLVLSGSACKTFQASHPMERYEKMQKDLSPSIVHLPIRVSRTEMEKALNEQLATVLYEDMDMEDNGGDRLQMKIEKMADIHIDLQGQQMNYSVPLAIWLRKGLDLGNVEAEATLTMDFITRFDIQSDWKLTSKTTVESFQWIKSPKLKLGFVNIPVKLIASKILERSKATISKAIDEQLTKSFDLQVFVKQAWKTLQAPVLLHDAFKIWLKIEPELMSMTPLLTERDSVISTISIQGHSEIIIGEKPKTKLNSQLPAFEFVHEVSDRAYSVNISTQIPYKEAERIALEQLKGETFAQGNYKAKIEDLKIFGRDKQLIVEAKLSGSYDGSIYFEGTPYFDKAKNRIEVRDLDFELETKSFLMRSASWLFRKSIIKKIKEQLNFPLSENLENIKEIINQQIAHYTLTKGIFLKGKLESLDIQNTFLTKKGIVIFVNSKGQLNLWVEQL